MKQKEHLRKIAGRVKKRTFAGVVCEMEVYTISPGGKKASASEPRLRFHNEEERAAHREGISRKMHARIINENFKPMDLYCTLTFDKKNECHSFRECWKLLSNYIRRIRRKYPFSKLAYYCGRGEKTNRYHVHLLAAGVPESAIISKWGYGEVAAVDRLWESCIYNGENHGPDYTALANYLFDHWDPEQGPHRYHHTRNLIIPKSEDYTPCLRNYSEQNPPKAPKGYKLVEVHTTKYGYLYFKYVKEPRQKFLGFDADIPKPKRSRKRRTRSAPTAEKAS